MFENGFAKIMRRSLIEIKGKDTIKYLQGLTTNNMLRLQDIRENLMQKPLPPSATTNGLFTVFLTAQGRVLYDTLIYPRRDELSSIFMECDDTLKEGLLKHLKRYKLANKVEIIDNVPNYSIYSLWGPKLPQLLQQFQQEENRDIGHSIVDPRLNELGLRLIVKNEDKALQLIQPQFSTAEESQGLLRRCMFGIPEGSLDYFTGSSLPLESNVDYMNGVDFRKGCYLGQELTIRTFHTGVTRKRIVPVQLFTPDQMDLANQTTEIRPDPTWSHPLPPSQSDIKLEGEGASRRSNLGGKFCSGVHNVGLALMRLDGFETSDTRGLSSRVMQTENGLLVKGFIPSWWPQNTDSLGGHFKN